MHCGRKVLSSFVSLSVYLGNPDFNIFIMLNSDTVAVRFKFPYFLSENTPLGQGEVCVRQWCCFQIVSGIKRKVSCTYSPYYFIN